MPEPTSDRNVKIPPGINACTARIVQTRADKVQLDHGQGVIMELERDGHIVRATITQRVVLGSDGAAWLAEWLGREGS